MLQKFLNILSKNIFKKEIDFRDLPQLLLPYNHSCPQNDQTHIKNLVVFTARPLTYV